MAYVGAPNSAAEAPEEAPLKLRTDGHMLDRKARVALVRQALATDDQDHEDLLKRTKDRFSKYGSTFCCWYSRLKLGTAFQRQIRPGPVYMCLMHPRHHEPERGVVSTPRKASGDFQGLQPC